MNTSGLVKGARVKLVHLAVNTLYCVSHNSDPDNCIFAKYTGPVGGFRMFKRVDLPENANPYEPRDIGISAGEWKVYSVRNAGNNSAAPGSGAGAGAGAAAAAPIPTRDPNKDPVEPIGGGRRKKTQRRRKSRKNTRKGRK
jgi:hypothetical protein